MSATESQCHFLCNLEYFDVGGGTRYLKAESFYNEGELILESESDDEDDQENIQ